MLKAGALYFAIVIAFLIAILSASLLMLAAYYKSSYLKEIRYTRLVNNLNSGLIYALTDTNTNHRIEKIDLYADGADSVFIERKKWGIFDMALIKAFILEDTLSKSMLLGVAPDSASIYLSDENRALLVGGTTKISGNVYLPKSGIKKTYVNEQPYKNEKLIYNGVILSSESGLVPLNKNLIHEIEQKLNTYPPQLSKLDNADLNRSFSESTLLFNIKEKTTLKQIKLKGNLIIYADSALTIAASTNLDGVQVYAPSIRIEEGFNGNAQFFALDSIVVDDKVKLNYPSVLAVLKTNKSGDFPKITIKKEVDFNGIAFTHEEKRSALQTLISLGEKTTVRGELYSTGLVKLEKQVAINGKVSCNQFLMNVSSILYDNILIDVTLNNKARSAYYLSSRLFNSKAKNKVLRWLE